MGDLVILLLTLFPGLCIAHLTGKFTLIKNLAVGAPAVQSSTYNSLGAAKNAVDGNSDSNYMRGSCTHTAGDNPWWRVDLRKPHKVTRVIITNRGDCCAERIAGAQIRIGNSLAYNGNRNQSIPSGGTKTFDFSPVKGRYVNIYLPGANKYLTLCEVQVRAATNDHFDNRLAG
uniref:Si:ch73-359m17.2 n=1 Tax=Cyprinus carpio TaxID=7962 RepID=A0A8C1QY27_CYPCA